MTQYIFWRKKKKEKRNNISNALNHRYQLNKFFMRTLLNGASKTDMSESCLLFSVLFDLCWIMIGFET